MRLQIHHQREIARLHLQDGNRTNREIARSTGVSPNTVKHMRQKVREAPITKWDLIKDLDDDAWCAALKSENRSIAQRKEKPDWDYINSEMQRPDATLEQLWREFKESSPDGVAYTQFSTGYRVWKKKLHVVMRRSHRPGEKLFVDFAGRTVSVTNRDDGTTWQAQIFVGVLGYSNYSYLEAVASQTIPDWVACHIHCFEAIGGAPEWVVSDRLKSAVLGSDRDSISITPAYREALRHYDTAPQPAGPRKPKEKAKAEVGVQIAQRWVLFRLRDRVFFDLDELNADLRRLCAELNDHPFKKIDGTRRTRFELERATLKPLPSSTYEYCDWRYGVLVGLDHHFEHERCYYSVPYHLQREKVDLRITATTIEAMHRGKRIALHVRLRTAGEASTHREHRPIAHVRVLEGEPRALAVWAGTVGPSTSRMFDYHLSSRTDPTNGVRAARRLRELADQYGLQRIEEVCTYALPLNITALRSLVSILKESADKRRRVATPLASPQLESHDNVRGPDYFGEDE